MEKILRKHKAKILMSLVMIVLIGLLFLVESYGGKEPKHKAKQAEAKVGR